MNAVAWFEIPVSDMDRAISFYSEILSIELHLMDMGPLKMAVWPSDPQSHGSAGALVQFEEFYVPSEKAGVLIYLSCTDVEEVLNRVRAKGNTILVEKKQISEEHGYMGLFMDSEGNRIALHSHQ